MNYKFKVGDKVVLIGNSYEGCFPSGSVCTINSCYRDHDGENYNLTSEGFSYTQIYNVNDLKKYISPGTIKEVVQEVKPKKTQHQVWGLAKKVDGKWEPRLLAFYKTRKEARYSKNVLAKIQPANKFKVIKVRIDTKEKA